MVNKFDSSAIDGLSNLLGLLKFIYSEKATKFCEISTLLLSYVVPVKSKVKILQNFVAFSEYMNFKFMDNCWISCQVMADMKKVYDNLIIINLYLPFYGIQKNKTNQILKGLYSVCMACIIFCADFWRGARAVINY